MGGLDAKSLAVIEKVKKLLALAQNNTNEEEAASASALAMRMLELHNLDMAVVGESRTSGARDDKKRQGGLYQWQRDLWEQVADLNFCMYWSIKGLVKGAKYQHRLLGRQDNVISAEVLAEYLQSTVERLAQAWAKQQGYSSVFVREAIAYREGLADRLCMRLRAARREQEDRDAKAKQERASSGTPGTALVIADVAQTERDLNQDHYWGHEPGTTAKLRAENAARQAAAMAAYHERMARETMERDLAEAADPKLKEARLKKEAKAVADAEKRWEKIKEKAGSYRAATPREQRAALSSYDEGFTKAADISLNRQIDEEGEALQIGEK